MNSTTHFNKKYLCLNITINIIFLVIFLLIVMTNRPIENKQKNSYDVLKNDKSVSSYKIEYFPKGDWMENTISHNIIAGEILCGVIKKKSKANTFFHDFYPYPNTLYENNVYYNSFANTYSTDCIPYKSANYITTENGKFKMLF